MLTAASLMTLSKPETSLQHAGLALEPDACDALLNYLVAQKWSRLQAEYDDPIRMLMNRGARQWTVGWAPDSTTLYLLVWEADSFNEQAWWRLYENGHCIFTEVDGQSKTRSALFNKLLESDSLPFATYQQWLSPILEYGQPGEWCTTAVQSILNTLVARPEIFNMLKNPLFKALEMDLGNPEWPLLEVMKIHRLAHKTPLIWLFQQLVQQGMIRTLQDNTRLDAALSLLQTDYFDFGHRVAPVFRSVYEQAYSEFRQLITDGTWRTSLRLKIPQQ